MIYSSKRSSPLIIDAWPSFVDVLSAVLMVVVFVLMTFLVSQVFLVETIQDRDSALSSLQNRIQLMQKTLEKTEEGKQLSQKKVQELEDLLNDLNRKLSVLNTDYENALEKASQIEKDKESFRMDADQLSKQLDELNKALEKLKTTNDEKDAEINDVNKKLKLQLVEAEKYASLKEVSNFRSEFFRELKNILGDRSDVRVSGDRFVFQSEVLFTSGSATLEKEGEKQLNELAKALKDIAKKIPKNIKWILRVDGHTDSIPIQNKFPSNWELASARALAVVKYLIQKGISRKHLVAASFADTQPLSKDKKDQARNRRIEFKLDQY